MKVTIVIPLRVTDDVFDARKRLLKIIANVPKEKFNILILDYGTPDSHICELNNLGSDKLRIIRYESSHMVFSIGHARDLGVQYAADPVVMFHDVDFFCTTTMYHRIHSEVISRKMDVNAYDFFCVPVFFLSEYGTEIASRLASDSDIADHNIHRLLYEMSPGVVEFPAYGSSAIVVNKNHYLGIGGHSREFYGHGAEDYDILHRLSAYYIKGPRTADYYHDTKSNQVGIYQGFRAYFALYGLDIFSKGIFLIHLWHPKRSIPGYHQSNRNFSLLGDLMRRFDKTRDQPHPLGCLNSGIRSLLLIKPDSSTFKAIRHAMSFFGDLEFVPEDDFGDGECLAKFCQKKEIDYVFFLNPYGNPHRLKLYQSIRSSGQKYFVFDRGALPDSWFFDPFGFNFDSLSYSPANWNIPLTNCQSEAVEKYIFDLRNGNLTLEENGVKKSGRFLREQYSIGNRKVLFVPFQRPSDTVTNHFAGPAVSVYEFQSWVSYISSQLSRTEWVVVCKNHPLDKDLPKIDGVIYADDGTHINDLLELADKVFLMNSGVGVLAMAFLKPVICASSAFYAHLNIAYPAKNKEEALDLIKKNILVDQDLVKRFFVHLTERVYSFGTSKYRKTIAEDGSSRSVVSEIIFRNIRIPGIVDSHMGVPPAGVTLDAPLFSSFGGRLGIKNLLQNKSNTKPSVKATTVQKKPSLAVVSPVHNSRANNNSRIFRKVRKLIRDPKLYFSDLFKKIAIKH